MSLSLQSFHEIADLYDKSSSYVSVKDLHFRFLYCNQAFANLYGTQKANLIGKTDNDFLSRQFADFYHHEDKTVISTRQALSREGSIEVPGRKVLVHVTKIPLIKENEVIGIVGIANDKYTIQGNELIVTDTVMNDQGSLGESWGNYSTIQAYLSDQYFQTNRRILNNTIIAKINSHQSFSQNNLVNSKVFNDLKIRSPALNILSDLQMQKLDFNDINWRQFEEVVAEMLELDGYKVRLQSGSKDGGVDTMAWRDVPRIGPVLSIWQAKHYKNGKVGLGVVRELADSINEFRASKGIVVTSSFLTKGALSRVERDKYTLGKIDRSDLTNWVLSLAI